MPEGFYVLNDSQTLQIDGEYLNPSLKRKGTVTTQAYSQSNGIPIAEQTFTGATIAINDDEIVAIACSTTPATIIGRNNGVVHIRTSNETGPSSTVGAVIEYWVFGKPTQTANYGMQVFGPGSTGLVYDAVAWKPFRPRAKVGLAATANQYERTPGTTTTLTSGRKYAVAMEQEYVAEDRAIQPLGIGGGGGESVMLVGVQFADGVKIVNNAITVQGMTVYTFVQGPWNYAQHGAVPLGWQYIGNNNTASSFVVIDVTNF